MSGTQPHTREADAAAPEAFRPVLLIPHYNHARQFLHSLPALQQARLPILVVDDGSDRTQREQLVEAAAGGGFELHALPVNQGKGAAVMAGFEAALAAGYSHALQLDADGQHDPGDIKPFLAAAARRPDTIICGTPLFGADAPWVRVWGRKLTDLVVLLETWTSGIRDSLCGFRVYPLHPIMATIRQHRPGARMDFDAELLVNACWAQMPLHFIDTRVIYPEQGVSHFRYLQDNTRMVAMHTRLMLRMLLRSPLLMADRLRGRGPQVSYAAHGKPGATHGSSDHEPL